MKATFVTASGVLLSLVCLISELQAAGESYGATQDDLQLSVNYRWAGGAIGGYYPIRIRLQNRGPAREVEFLFHPTVGNRLPVVTRRVSIDQNASAKFSLLIPMAGDGDSGELLVLNNGRPLERLSHRISLPGVDYENARPGLLAVSSTNIDLQPLEDALTSLNRISGGSGHHHFHGSITTNHETVDPAWLPESWLAWSSVDLAAIELETLNSLTDDQAGAIRDWMLAGGTFIVTGLGEGAAESEELGKFLQRQSRGQPLEWRDPEFNSTRSGITVYSLDEHGNEDSYTESEPTFSWPESGSPFQIADFGFGRIIGFEEDPFPGTPQDWGWLLKNLPYRRLVQGNRLGTSGRLSNDEFLDFLIPGIRSVPVVAFLIFISLFAFIIGPLNYFLLSRKNRLNLLVITIPAIAFVTSAILITYSVVSHGFSVKSRVRSLTLIDQGSQTAVTSARLAVYAGISPSSGLDFSPATAVMPIRPEGQSFESARTDWTDMQSLETGWLRSRTRTQFLTLNVRPERGRLNVTTPSTGQMNVTNGFEWDIEQLVLTNDNGDVFSAENLVAGAAAEVRPTTPADRQKFVDLLNRSAPAIPEELKRRSDVTDLNFSPGMRHYWGNVADFHVSNGQMEQRIQQIRQDVTAGNPLPRRTFFAVVKTAPSIEFGTEVELVDSWHLVVGTY